MQYLTITLLFTLFCAISASERYTTGFRTSKSARRSNFKRENSKQSSLYDTESDSLASFPIVEKFQEFKNEGEQKIKDGVESAQENMLSFWTTYKEGMKDMESKFKGLLSKFGVPKKFYDDDNNEDEEDDTVSRFINPRGSISSTRDSKNTRLKGGRFVMTSEEFSSETI